MTVSQLSAYLKGVFDDEELLHDVTLTGEVADISYSDKHTFLVLADGNCSIKCVHFSSRDDIAKGARVAVKGSVGFYGKRSSVSFNYSEFFLCGNGDKNARLAALKQKLYERGYFENRPQLPKYIVDVAVITSPDGAAIRDFMRVVGDKCPFVKIRVIPARVQGEGAAPQLAEAVKRAQSYKTDALVLCRGGGSDEDLDCFNDEELSVAVARSAIPVISAVGHEIDYTLCDFCAGTRAGTPSIAGEIVNSRALALIADIYRLADSCRAALDRKLDMCKRLLERLSSDVVRTARAHISDRRHEAETIIRRSCYAVEKRIALRYGELTGVARKAESSLVRALERKREKTNRLSALTAALDPNRIIKIGYAAVLRDKNKITSASELNDGDKIRLVFADGTATATVDKVIKNEV